MNINIRQIEFNSHRKEDGIDLQLATIRYFKEIKKKKKKKEIKQQNNKIYKAKQKLNLVKKIAKNEWKKYGRNKT